MSLQYVKTKEELPPNSDSECPICLEPIDIDEAINGVPNCVICSNGHRIHNNCFNSSRRKECPVCRSTEIKFCKSKSLGYSYVARKGGKRRKTHKKGKTHKKRKTKNNRRLKCKKN